MGSFSCAVARKCNTERSLNISKMLRIAGSIAGLTLVSHLAGQKVKAESLPWQKEGNNSPGSLDFSWVLDKKTLVKPERKEQNKVLLLAYPRTGSSLLGELMATQPDTSYFMEPLFAMMPVGQLDWDYVLEGRIASGEVPVEAVTALMGGIYTCNEIVIDRLEDWSKAPHTSVTAVPTSVCGTSRTLLAKTVRLHGTRVREVVRKVEDLQVVHIVRDPRAVTASLKAQQEEWGDHAGDTYCKQVLADLGLEDELGPERYIRVRYEDLVETPMAVLERIGAFTGVPVTDEIREAVAVKMGGEEKVTESTDSNNLAATMTTDYYSTVRAPGHKHDAWRRKLSEKEIVSLECGVCEEVMEKLGYKKVKRAYCSNIDKIL